jgi:hypothetical protein
MLLEWIHYYAKLGFKVMVYDRDGLNRKVIDAEYSHAKALNIKLNRIVHLYEGTPRKPWGAKELEQRRRMWASAQVHYFPYTIRGLMNPATKGIRYDNNEVCTIQLCPLTLFSCLMHVVSRCFG